eukprot:gene13975-biopygen3591
MGVCSTMVLTKLEAGWPRCQFLSDPPLYPGDEVPRCLVRFAAEGETPLGDESRRKPRSRLREPKDSQFASAPAQEEGQPVVFDRPLGITQGGAAGDPAERTLMAAENVLRKLRQSRGVPHVQLTTEGSMLDQTMFHMKLFFYNRL